MIENVLDWEVIRSLICIVAILVVIDWVIDRIGKDGG